MSREILLEEYFYIFLGIIHGLIYLSIYFPNDTFEFRLLTWLLKEIRSDVSLSILVFLAYPISAYLIAKNRKYDQIFLKYKLYAPTAVILFIVMMVQFWFHEWRIDTQEGAEEVAVGYIVFIFILYLLFLPIISLYTFPTISIFCVVYILTSYRQPIRPYRKSQQYPIDREYERTGPLYIDTNYSW